MALEATSHDVEWFDVALTVADDTEESVLGSDLPGCHLRLARYAALPLTAVRVELVR